MIKYITILLISLSFNLFAYWIPFSTYNNKNIDLLFYASSKNYLKEGHLRTDDIGSNTKLLYGYLGKSVIAITYQYSTNNIQLAHCPYRVSVYQNALDNIIYDNKEFDLYISFYRYGKFMFKSKINEDIFSILSCTLGGHYLIKCDPPAQHERFSIVQYESRISLNLLQNIDEFSLEYIKK